MRLLAPFSLFAVGAALAQSPSFEHSVQPVINKSCVACHNDRSAAGGLNIVPFQNQASLASNRDDWERIIQKIRTGEMPPKGMPRPTQAQADELMSFVTAEFERADKLVKPDPGRVTARRLNRNEYTNTIRDLLGVEFRADRDFPTDDSGYGFDNIGDVLTISPILMEKYLNAAERIAARAIGADPLPKPVEKLYHNRDKAIRRIDRSTIEASHRVDFEGEYTIRFGLPGERGPDAAPVKLGLWMDGKLLQTLMAETKPSKLVYFNPYSEEEMRLSLPEGDHVFRVGFIDDPFVKDLTDKEAYNNKKNKWLESILFIGPFPEKTERPSRKQLLTCDPKSGDACIESILSKLARRAYRRPVTKDEVAKLTRFVGIAKQEGLSTEQGLQLAIQAVLVSPHFLFRVERDSDPSEPRQVTDLELASRLSYFLWSSMPDEELLQLAEANKLRPALDGQIQRMLADPKASAFAENFAGQWLEIRNLDSVKPDPVKFPAWNAELRDAMKTETRLFFQAMLTGNRPMAEFIDAKFTFLNETLAKHYGIDGITGNEFRRVELSNPQRGGILTHASVLTVSSYPTRTSPVIRGKYILQNILGAPPPAPPPDVPALDEEKMATAGSLRQQMEKHRTNPTCASCHNRMDVLGFGLENYDGIGTWRTKDGKFDLDTSGIMPNGKSFQNPSEMRVVLQSELPDFARCVTEKMLTYALGRGLERYDRRTIETITKSLAPANYPFQALVKEIVHSLPFQMRRGETPREKSSQQVANR